MRKFSAHYIFTGTGVVLKKGIVVTNDEGVITDLIDTGGNLEEIASVEFYNGILVPGFVNSHCHLELSHLRGVFPEKLKLAEFLRHILLQRSAEEETIIESADKADKEMWEGGISAVGDISNLNLTFGLKKTSKIFYHTFIETLGFSPERAERAFKWASFYLEDARILGLKASMVPHAPYSISQELFEKISGLSEKDNSILSLHSQESILEDELYRSGTGAIYNHLTENLLLDLSFFTPSGKSALATVLGWLPTQNKLLLVHNTCTKAEDIDMISRVRPMDKTWFVLCPNSNLYIEDRLPDINLFQEKHLQICLGTDSLSSNRQLSIIEEMKTIQNYFPQITLLQLINWATKNGAEALDISNWAGTLAKGKKPGINLIHNIDLQKLKLLPQSKVKRLI